MPGKGDGSRWLFWVLGAFLTVGIALAATFGGWLTARGSECRDLDRAQAEKCVVADAKQGEVLARHETQIQVMRRDNVYQTAALERLEKKFQTGPQ